MKIKEIERLIPIAHKHRLPLFFWGNQGVGKSQLLEQVCKKLDLGFVRLNLAAQEVGDIVGLLDKTPEGFVRHLMPEWFPTKGKGIIYLDEFNRAHPDVLQAIFPLLTEYVFHTHILPEGWSVMAAGNHNSNQFNVTDTSDAALNSRFCHIDFLPTKEEFIIYAESLGCDGADSIAAFIRNHPEMLETANTGTNTGTVFETIKPDRRAWLKYVAPLETESEIGDFRFEVYSGIVGKTAAAAFMTDKNKKEKRLSGKDILRRYESVKKDIKKYSDAGESRFDIINSAVEEIFLTVENNTLTTKEMENFKTFILDIPLEMGLKIVKKLQGLSWSQKNEILNKKEFVDLFKKAKLKKK